ncbi:hypothetical protein RI065_07210 [Mycoplasmatota bacterium zrk1]
MNDNDLKKYLQAKIKMTVPNKIEDIKSSPEFYVKRSSVTFKNRFRYSFASILILIIATLSIVFKTDDISTIVSLDINPSIMIMLNAKEEVVNLKGNNFDGEELINDLNYNKLNVEEVVEVIMTRALEQDYILDEDIILLGIESDDEELKNSLATKLNEKIKNKMMTKNKNVDVIIEKFASKGNSDELKVSNAKDKFIMELIENSNYTMEDYQVLSQMKIKDLNSRMKENEADEKVEQKNGNNGNSNKSNKPNN